MDEWLPIVDKNGNVQGRALRSICHNGSFLLHPVVHLHLFNSEGELCLQKRASTKDIQPNKMGHSSRWSCWRKRVDRSSVKEGNF